jgi:DNA invertase Pin-like site-specific DNA recombinase
MLDSTRRPGDNRAVKKACAYFRTSSATNVGNDKDSEKRQQDAVRSYAARNGIEIVAEYYDAAVSGADPVDARPAFSAMVAYMLGNGARTILVETANRFARDLIVQETGYKMLKDKGADCGRLAGQLRC